MKVKEWLPELIERHQSRHPREDWPDPDEERHARLWLDAMLSLDPRPRQVEAEAASRDLDASSLAWAEDHPLAVVAAIRRAREQPARQAQAAAFAGFVLGSTVEARKAQTEALLDELHGEGFEFTWDAPSNRYLCMPAQGPYRRPSDEQCRRIQALARGLWTALAPLRAGPVE